jgi:hypothetical protein
LIVIVVPLQVSLYNALPDVLHPSVRNFAAERMFRKGRHLAIIEPFYKRFADGTQGIRVDNPSEVCCAGLLGYCACMDHVVIHTTTV